MNPPVVLFGTNALLCTHCKINFYVSGGEDRARHFTIVDVESWGLAWDKILAECPNAGKTFQLPACVQIMDEETP